MATYFHGNSEIQAPDGIQTLYLMNPNYVPYSDTTILFNPAGNALSPSVVSLAPPSSNHHLPLVGVPLPSPSPLITHTNSEDINNRSSFQGVFSGVQQDLWTSIEQNSAPNHPQIVTLAAPGDDSQVDLRRPLASSCRQGLSLSLSSQQGVHNRPTNAEVDMQGRGQVGLMRASENSPSSVSVVSNGISITPSVVLGSKYLKPAQELLDEVVNVGSMLFDSTQVSKEKMKLHKETTDLTGEGSNGDESSSAKIAAELTMAQRQELQIKKGKLVTMLDEVEQRYRQYNLQMQLVVSSFEQMAGFGSAKSYTSLALRTISKQFRCLKDAISGQITTTSKKLGEEDFLGGKLTSSRLKYVDHQLRQQRAFQQLGMMQHNAWRSQRGLPERAVSVLRAWLFEHFLHPYPKDSDKLILAKQTGLTRSQVSNWFINARVRLWKPMVEEMYLEEMKEQQQNGFEENASRPNKQKEQFKLEQEKAVHDKTEKSSNQNASPTKLSNSTMSTSPVGGTLLPQTGFNLIGSSDLEGVVKRNAKKTRSSAHDMYNSIEMEIKGDTSREISGNNKFGGERLNKDGYALLTNTNHGGGFGTYTMEEMESFNPDRQMAPIFHANGFSLTLGLPHAEKHSLSGNQQNLLSRQNIQLGRGLELGISDPDNFCGINSPQPSDSSAGFENIDIQSRKRFAVQLLPDFLT